MGLAASQARFLNLTARKTNLEYEGQQINQQRTVLANQSANTYNQMLTLSVPTPPSETAYQTIVYNFTNGGNSYSINQVTGKDSSATILATETHINDYSMNASQGTVSTNNGQYYVGSADHTLIKLSNATDAGIAAASSEILSGMQAAWDNEVSTTGRAAKQLSTSDIYYVNVGTNRSPVYRYYFASDVTNATYNTDSSATVKNYTAGSATEYNQAVFSNAVITRDVNNRIVAISHSSFSSTAPVTSTTVKDTVAYEDAYNEYEYQTYLYQQRMEQINAQTSVIQAQDKKLELRLKQLDTEQNAIKTEMESVSSVVKKNVEDTFKIFA